MTFNRSAAQIRSLTRFCGHNRFTAPINRASAGNPRSVKTAARDSVLAGVAETPFGMTTNLFASIPCRV